MNLFVSRATGCSAHRYLFAAIACALLLVRCGNFSPTLLSTPTGADSGSTSEEPSATPSAGNVRITDTSGMTKPIGKVAMTGCVSFDYFANFSIGGSTVSLLVDSGSTTLAAAASSCTTCGVDQAYTPSAKGTSTGRTTSSTYLDGSEWAGTLFTDTAVAGTAAQPATPGVSLTFAAITQQNSFFEEVTCAAVDDTKFDGIAGLGPDSLLTSGTTSFLSLLAPAAKTAVDAFALQTCDLGGTLWFGGYDPNAASAVPKYTPMLRNRAYAVTVTSMAVGGRDLGLSSTQIGPMVVDNGTNSILLPSAAFDAFEKTVEANAAFLANFGPNFISAQSAACVAPSQGLTRAQLDAALPSFSMTFPDETGGTFTVEVPATSSYLTAGTVSNDASKTVLYCPAIASSPSNSINIIGNSFMRGHIVIFDRTGQRIGFAPQVGCTPQSVVYNAGT